jgi:polyisoprenoid-binding protein YceI
MKTRNLIGVFATALTVSLVLGLAPQEEKPAAKPAAAKGAKFSVDDVHSSLIFGIEHMGVSMFYGRFNDLGGHYTLDLNSPEASTFEITAATDSVDTGNGGRDRHLKGADFFNAAEFPKITFKSAKVSKIADGKLQVTGDLTMHGVTKPVTMDMKVYPPKSTERGTKSGIAGQFNIKRTDFGMDTYVSNGGLGDEVTIIFGIEGNE